MITLITLIAMSCPPTKLIGFAPVLTKLDEQSMEAAAKRCPELYPASPCLKYFIKVEENVYRVICGAKSET